MKTPKILILISAAMVFATAVHAQRYIIRNTIGLQGGITKFDILTDNFETKANTGYIGGLTASVDLPHKWYNVSYNILLSENNIDISASPFQNATNEFVEYKMLTAQVSLLLHVRVIGNKFTLDVGPVLQYNGELELKDDEKEGYFVSNYDNLLAKDISGITKFNANGAVGISAGFNHFKLRAQYQYGFTNILGKLNDNDFNITNSDKFKGNQSLLAFTAILSF